MKDIFQQYRPLIITSVIALLGLMTISHFITKSPSEVVEAVYMAANDGNYSKVKKHSSKSVLNSLDNSLIQRLGTFKGYWKAVTRNGTIDKIEITKEEIRGDVAGVGFTIYYKTGKTKKNVVRLVKENGGWKI